MERTIVCYTDGATEGVNGKLGTVTHVGLGIYIPDLELSMSRRCRGISNNEAEFLALLDAMRICLAFGLRRVEFRSDSTVVVNRATGKRTHNNNERMNAFADRVHALAEQFEYCTFVWIPRAQNAKADSLSKNTILYVPVDWNAIKRKRREEKQHTRRKETLQYRNDRKHPTFGKELSNREILLMNA